MPSPCRVTAVALALSLCIPLAGLTGTTAQAAPPRSGPYVNGTTPLSGGTGSVLDVATLKDDSVFVASSLSNGTGVLDIVDNTGDNFMPDDDSLAFPSAVLGVAANQVDDTAYFVTDSSAAAAGVVWTTRTSAASNSWNSVTWGDDTFVAVSSDGTGNRVMTSPDGINWTTRTSAANNQWQSVTWGGPAGQKGFVAVSSPGTVMTSPDGITWTTRTAAVNNSWKSVTWGDDTYVAVSITGTNNRVMTSPDGINWTSRTSAANNSWNSVTWGDDTFVAVSPDGGGNRVMTSPDGINWTTRTSAADNAWNSVTWGGPAGQKKFVAVSTQGTVMTSNDAIAWTTRTSAANSPWSSVTWGGPAGQERFVALSYTGPAMTSPDGITWTLQSSTASNSVTWGGPGGQQNFVAVGFNRVVTSGTTAAPAGGRATLWSYARGALDDSAPMPGTGVGGAWADIAVNNADDTVYVASQDDTRIIAFRSSNLDDSRSITLPAGTTPYALAVNQADDTVYVLSYASGTTSYLTAMRGANPDDSTTVTLTMVPGRQALAVNPVDGTVYAGGWSTVGKVEAYSPTLTFANVAVIGMGPSVSGVGVSGDGRRLYATADNDSAYLFNTANFADTASVALGVTSPGAIAIDDYGWAWTGSPSTTTGSRSLLQIGTAPTFTNITPASGPTAGGTTATITGSWFTASTTAAFGVDANVGTTIGTPTSNSMSVTVPPGPAGAAGAAELILANVAGPSQPLGVNASGTFTYVDPPLPSFPPSPPRDVTAVAGDASATVTWAAPANPGSFPVSNYSVTASPGAKTCLTSTLTCEITGLTNGMRYTFTVKALNGAGWSPESAPSNAVTPKATAKPSILIAGSRDGSTIRVDGTTTDLTGNVTPWVKFPGQTRYTEGTARPVITDNAFTWSRRANKKAYVYFAHDATKSNTVTIATR